jgi:hypothetical protein
MWYLRRGVILTKDNLVKCNWQDNEKCCFCHENETIKHLFLEYRFARVVWSCIQAALNLPQPRSISHLFGSWLRGFQKDLKPLILLGAVATCWSLWLCRNNLVLEKKHVYSPLHVVYSVIYWLCTWVILKSLTHRLWCRRHCNNWCKRLQCFSPGHIGDDLVLELIVTRVSGGSRFLSLRLCV